MAAMDLAPALENPAMDLDYEKRAVSTIETSKVKLNQGKYQEIEKVEEERQLKEDKKIIIKSGRWYRKYEVDSPQRDLSYMSSENYELDRARNKLESGMTPGQTEASKESLTELNNFDSCFPVNANNQPNSVNLTLRKDEYNIDFQYAAPT
jgi:hypothetical protein